MLLSTVSEWAIALNGLRKLSLTLLTLKAVLYTDTLCTLQQQQLLYSRRHSMGHLIERNKKGVKEGEAVCLRRACFWRLRYLLKFSVRAFRKASLKLLL